MSRLKQALDVYVHHRPTVQRLLTAGFVLYCLGTTYQNLSGKGAKGGAREKVSRKGKGASGGGRSHVPIYSRTPSVPLEELSVDGQQGWGADVGG